MLFDLRGRGRRRTVQAIYLTLAILMGGGLVLFGIGGNTEGGLFDAFRNDAQTNNQVFDDRLKAAEKQTRTAPTDPKAWAALTRAQYQVASAGEGYDQTTGTFTDKGRVDLAKVERSWTKYLSLKPKPVDDKLAILMVQAFGPGGLNKNDEAVSALEAVIDVRGESAALYVQLATLAYLANQTRKGDLSGEKALELANKDDREQIKGQLESAKSAAAQQAVQDAQGATPPAG